eukprot:TRINITY_DN14262_c0_g2_i1.p1 TRINITY_DN14262_c0_g2~~TRINITY_DN14262_c0_g2_i1.p1  ORF type:complete len:191 (-),score=19.48 TRINITY_DN14262_c0_g2_i1:51-578(-)
MPPFVVRNERYLQRATSAPLTVWWDNQHGVSQRRDFGELDEYGVLDKLEIVRGGGCQDDRFRRIDMKDKTRFNEFAPRPDPLTERYNGPQPMRDARPVINKLPGSWKLDPYGIRLGDSFTIPDKSRRLEYRPCRLGDRFEYRKPFDKDFSVLGWSTNKFFTGIRGENGKLRKKWA